ncbi:MAG TPA: hypothetical protein GXX29_06195, partial [Firmicutes bacterium]|nr:hypothetical protein [Bacillota bacterium]
LTAKAQSADGNQRFFTILVPRPAAEADQAPPLAKATEATNGCSATVTVGGKEITIAFRDSSAERLEVAGFSTDAVAIAIWREVDGTKSGVMAVNATSISRQGEVLFSSENPADGAWDLVDGRLVVAVAE